MYLYHKVNQNVYLYLYQKVYLCVHGRRNIHMSFSLCGSRVKEGVSYITWIKSSICIYIKGCICVCMVGGTYTRASVCGSRVASSLVLRISPRLPGKIKEGIWYDTLPHINLLAMWWKITIENTELYLHSAVFPGVVFWYKYRFLIYKYTQSKQFSVNNPKDKPNEV